MRRRYRRNLDQFVSRVSRRPRQQRPSLSQLPMPATRGPIQCRSKRRPSASPTQVGRPYESGRMSRAARNPLHRQPTIDEDVCAPTYLHGALASALRSGLRGRPPPFEDQTERSCPGDVLQPMQVRSNIQGEFWLHARSVRQANANRTCSEPDGNVQRPAAPNRIGMRLC
jgi:hypothetical protein